jgi:exopolysaccharide biosynthesis polyprenyl glycosylphosphotransferase
MLKRHWKKFFIGLSRVVDILAMIGAAFALIMLNEQSIVRTNCSEVELGTGLLIFGACYFLLTSMFGYYRGAFRHKYRTRMTIAGKAYLLSMIISISIFVLIFHAPIHKRAMAVFSVAFPVLFVFGKSVLWRLHTHCREKGFGAHPSLVAGIDSGSVNLYKHFDAIADLGYSVRGFIMQDKDSGIDLQPQYTLQDVERVIRDEKIDTIFIPSADLVVNGYSSLEQISRRNGIKLRVLSPQSRSLMNFAKVHDIAGISLTSRPCLTREKIKLGVKRVFDVVGALAIILLLSPIFLVTMLLILIEDGRPIFYTQHRGSVRNGSSFRFIKFRTMVPDADKMLNRLKSLNESDGALFKMKNDPRITRVGRYLRKFSIDELPQLFNVLIGDMSLVGPRPLPLADFERVDAPKEFWDAVKERGRVKPGMTGIWQVSGRSEIKFKEMILLDLYYVENFSLMFDLELLLETVNAVLFSRGAY